MLYLIVINMRKYSCCAIIKQALFVVGLTHSPASVYAWTF
jgi:hypothetical protein